MTENPVIGFDVFLSHNGRDKPAVRELKRLLSERSLSCWLDVDELQPGLPWADGLEQGIRASRSTGVFVGPDGIGPWEDVEMRAALQLSVNDGRPVIPVILPGLVREPELPLFLSGRTWVDLRPEITPEKLDRLIWGITGRPPNGVERATPVAGTLPPPNPRRTFSGRAKIEFCRRLGDDWKPLADVLEIPGHEIRALAAGDESRGIWAWLEVRRRLHALVPALTEIGRDDLAAMLGE